MGILFFFWKSFWESFFGKLLVGELFWNLFMASIEFSPLPSFIKELDVLLSDWEYVHGLDIYLYTIYTQSCYSVLLFTGYSIGIYHVLCWSMGWILIPVCTIMFYSAPGGVWFIILRVFWEPLFVIPSGTLFPRRPFYPCWRFLASWWFLTRPRVRGIVYINFRELFRSLPSTVVVGMRIEGECWI